MLDLKRRRPDVRAYVAGLEEWIIRTLAAFNVRGERREDRVGVWVARPEKGAGHEDKIAAIGVRLHRWVSFHGISINVEPDLSHSRRSCPAGWPIRAMASQAWSISACPLASPISTFRSSRRSKMCSERCAPIFLPPPKSVLAPDSPRRGLKHAALRTPAATFRSAAG